MISTPHIGPVVIAASHLMNTEPSFDGFSGYNKCTKRSLLPFSGDALSWLTGTTTTKDVTSIKKRINQLITTQAKQQDTLVSILNITRYATQTNRQHINIVIDPVDRIEQDNNNHHNITNSLYTSLSHHQLVLHIRSILANPSDYLTLEQYPHIQWITPMQPPLEPFHLTSYQLRTLGRCYHTLRKHYFQLCIYQSHLWTCYISTDIYIPRF